MADYNDLLAAQDAASDAGRAYGHAHEVYRRTRTKKNLLALYDANQALDSALAACERIEKQIAAQEAAKAAKAKADRAAAKAHASPKFL